MTTTCRMLQEFQERFDGRSGPRVGDYLVVPRTDPRQRPYSRFTWDHGVTMQTLGRDEGSFFAMHMTGGMSYSGGLYAGVRKDDLIETGGTVTGTAWVFRDNEVRAHNGVDVTPVFREFRLRGGSDTSGLAELRTSLYLMPNIHNRNGLSVVSHGFLGDVEKAGTLDECLSWIKGNGYTVPDPLPESTLIPLEYAGLPID